MTERDYEALGFMSGLEIHQQLDTGKLFCRCPSHLDEDVTLAFERTLRPVQSELGEVDRAALEQAERDQRFRYDASDTTACLVEMDEEPPHPVDDDAVHVSLTVARLLEMDPVDEVHIMRKLVIDGSNTAGFQRTSLLATGGALDTSYGPVGIDTLCLEEDACRKTDRTGPAVGYRLDRLGIPLVEIATAPDLDHPEQVREAAEGLGSLLRATGRVKRGLGTIRQDLNVSIREGARVELKGVQDLDILDDAARWEVERQVTLLEVRTALEERGITHDDLTDLPHEDVTALLEGTDSHPIQTALKDDGRVLAIALPGFQGLLGSKDQDPDAPRLGRELAGYAKARAGVPGIFHSDELPGYGITPAEVEDVEAALGTGSEDALVLVAADADTAHSALDAVADRARTALEGVPEETRDVMEDGTSRYLRPLPGSARMYPETDVPPLRVTGELLDEVDANLPETLEEKRARLTEAYDVSTEEVQSLVRTGRADAFEELAEATGLEREAATTLVTYLPTLLRDGVPEDRLTTQRIREVLEAVDEGTFAKDAIPDVLEHAAREDVPVTSAVEALGLEAVGREEVEAAAEEILDANQDLVEERGMGAMGPLMGDLMARFRGNAPGDLVSEVLKEKLLERT